MNDTWKAILGGIVISILLGILAVAFCALFQNILGMIAGLFVYIVIKLAGIGW